MSVNKNIWYVNRQEPRTSLWVSVRRNWIVSGPGSNLHLVWFYVPCMKKLEYWNRPWVPQQNFKKCIHKDHRCAPYGAMWSSNFCDWCLQVQVMMVILSMNWQFPDGSVWMNTWTENNFDANNPHFIHKVPIHGVKAGLWPKCKECYEWNVLSRYIELWYMCRQRDSSEQIYFILQCCFSYRCGWMTREFMNEFSQFKL